MVPLWVSKDHPRGLPQRVPEPSTTRKRLGFRASGAWGREEGLEGLGFTGLIGLIGLIGLTGL